MARPFPAASRLPGCAGVPLRLVRLRMEYARGWAPAGRWKRAARLRLELSQRRAHPFLSVEGETEFVREPSWTAFQSSLCPPVVSRAKCAVAFPSAIPPA